MRDYGGGRLGRPVLRITTMPEPKPEDFHDVAIRWERDLRRTRSARHKLFQQACVEMSACAVKEDIDRTIASDAMSEIGHAHEKAIGGTNAIQHIIAACIEQAERNAPEWVPDLEDEASPIGPGSAQANGHAGSKRFTPIAVDDIILRDEPAYLVDRIIPMGPCVVVIVGQR